MRKRNSKKRGKRKRKKRDEEYRWAAKMENAKVFILFLKQMFDNWNLRNPFFNREFEWYLTMAFLEIFKSNILSLKIPKRSVYKKKSNRNLKFLWIFMLYEKLTLPLEILINKDLLFYSTIKDRKNIL